MASRSAFAVITVTTLFHAACAELPSEAAGDRDAADPPSRAESPPEGTLDTQAP